MTIDNRGQNPQNPDHVHLERFTVIPQRLILWLVIAALGLPIVLCVLYALARLLAAMQDQAGAACLDRIALIFFASWVIDLVALVILQAIHSLGDRHDHHGE